MLVRLWHISSVPAFYGCRDPDMLISPAESAHPRQLLFPQHCLLVSPLSAILMDSFASIANKRLRACPSPLDATLTKNRGVPGRPPAAPPPLHHEATAQPPNPFQKNSWAHLSKIGQLSGFRAHNMHPSTARTSEIARYARLGRAVSLLSPLFLFRAFYCAVQSQLNRLRNLCIACASTSVYHCALGFFSDFVSIPITCANFSPAGSSSACSLPCWFCWSWGASSLPTRVDLSWIGPMQGNRQGWWPESNLSRFSDCRRHWKIQPRSSPPRLECRLRFDRAFPKGGRHLKMIQLTTNSGRELKSCAGPCSPNR
jgi:hypothetical protein